MQGKRGKFGPQTPGKQTFSSLNELTTRRQQQPRFIFLLISICLIVSGHFAGSATAGRRREEKVILCAEFLSGGTETTSTALQWIMENLVKQAHIQAKHFEEISGVVEEGREEVREEDLQKIPYLKGVILEGLRRNPPMHFLLPHSVTRDVTLEGFVIPKDTVVNFMVADMGWNPRTWEDPVAYKPERFMNKERNGVEAFDVTGRKEIKMIPVGAGRRICPGYELAILHLEYFAANLVLNFERRAVDGEDVDLSEKQELTVVMKNPLQVHLSPRWK